MSWSRQFNSLKDFNAGSTCPDDCDEDTYNAAYTMAKAGIKGATIGEADLDKKHTLHADNQSKVAQAQIRINIFGHGGGSGSPASFGCTISEI